MKKILPKKVTQSLVDHWVMLCREHDLGEPSLAYTVRQEEGGVSILAIDLPVGAVVTTATQQPRQEDLRGGVDRIYNPRHPYEKEAQRKSKETYLTTLPCGTRRLLSFDDETGEVRVEKSTDSSY